MFYIAAENGSIAIRRVDEAASLCRYWPVFGAAVASVEAPVLTKAVKSGVIVCHR